MSKHLLTSGRNDSIHVQHGGPENLTGVSFLSIGYLQVLYHGGGGWSLPQKLLTACESSGGSKALGALGPELCRPPAGDHSRESGARSCSEDSISPEGCFRHCGGRRLRLTLYTCITQRCIKLETSAIFAHSLKTPWPMYSTLFPRSLESLLPFSTDPSLIVRDECEGVKPPLSVRDMYEGVKPPLSVRDVCVRV